MSFFILCNFTDVSKFSQKVLCHILNLLAVTPIADPAIVKELYFPLSFFLSSWMIAAIELDKQLTIRDVEYLGKYQTDSNTFIFRGIPYAEPPSMILI